MCDNMYAYMVPWISLFEPSKQSGLMFRLLPQELLLRVRGCALSVKLVSCQKHEPLSGQVGAEQTLVQRSDADHHLTALAAALLKPLPRSVAVVPVQASSAAGV